MWSPKTDFIFWGDGSGYRWHHIVLCISRKWGSGVTKLETHLENVWVWTTRSIYPDLILFGFWSMLKICLCHPVFGVDLLFEVDSSFHIVHVPLLYHILIPTSDLNKTGDATALNDQLKLGTSADSATATEPQTLQVWPSLYMIEKEWRGWLSSQPA